MMTCSICNYTEFFTFAHTALKRSYRCCKHCEGIMLEPSDKLTEAEEKYKYDQHQNSLDNSGYVAMFESFLDFFWDELTCKAPQGLDFGSGPTPVLSELMKQRGANIECYDKFYQPIVPFEGKQYDFITSTEVFEHLDQPKEELTLLAHHLKKGGILALMTLFHSNDTEHFLKWWYPRDLTHITFYSEKTLVILGAMCGLKLLKSDGKRVVVFIKG